MGVAIGHDPSCGQDDRAFADLGGERQVVGHDQHRPVDAREQFHELPPRAGVQVGRGLVEHQQLRSHRQHGRDGDAATLALRQLVRRTVDRVIHAHGGECVGDPRLDLGPRQLHVERSKRHVLSHRRHEELVVRVLEHQPDASAKFGQRLLADVQAGDLQRSAAGGQQTVEVEHERGLARAIRTEDRNALTMLDTQIETVQRNLAVGIPVAQLADVDGAAHRITRNGTSARTTAAMNTTSARPTVIGAIWGISSRYPRAAIARYTRSPRP